MSETAFPWVFIKLPFILGCILLFVHLLFKLVKYHCKDIGTVVGETLKNIKIS